MAIRNNDGSVTINLAWDDRAVEKGTKNTKKNLGTIEDTARTVFQNSSKQASKFESSLISLKNTAKKVGGELKELGLSLSGLGLGIAGLTTGTADLKSELNKLYVTFNANGKSMQDANDTMYSFYRILGEYDTAIEASNHLAILTNNTKELAKWTDIAAGVHAVFGDSLALEGLTESANETAKVAKVTGTLADALVWAGVNEDYFNARLQEYNTTAERSTFITNSLSDIYKKVGVQYRALNKDVEESRQAWLRLQIALVGLGNIFRPVITQLVNWMADFVTVTVQGINYIIQAFNNLFGRKSSTTQAITVQQQAIATVNEGYVKQAKAIDGVGDAMVSQATATATMSEVLAKQKEDVQGTADAQDQFTEGVENTNKELNRSLAGFDNLQQLILDTNEAEGGGSGEGGGGIGGGELPPDFVAPEDWELLLTPELDIKALEKSIAEVNGLFGSLVNPDVDTSVLEEKIRSIIELLRPLTNGIKTMLSTLDLTPLIEAFGRLADVIDIRPIVESLGRLFEGIDFRPIISSLAGLVDVITKFTPDLTAGMVWLIDNVLAPLSAYVINELVPKFIDLIAAALNFLLTVIVTLKPTWLWMWDNFFYPLSVYVGDAILNFLDYLIEKLNNMSSWVESNPELFNAIVQSLISWSAAIAVEIITPFLDLLVAGLNFLATAIITLKPTWIWLWENFLAPAIIYTGTGILAFLDYLTEKLNLASEWMASNPDVFNGIVQSIISWTVAITGEIITTFLDLLMSTLNLLVTTIVELQPTWSWMWDNFFAPLGAWTGETVLNALDSLILSMNDISSWIETNSQLFNDIVQTLIMLTGTITGIWAAFKAWNGIKLIIDVVIASVQALALATNPVFLGITLAVLALIPSFVTFKEEIQQVFTDIGDICREIWEEWIEPVFEAWKEDWDILYKKHIKPFWENFKKFTNSIVELALHIWNAGLKPLIDWIVTLFGPPFTAVFSGLGDLVRAFVSIIAEIVGAILGSLGELISFVTDVFKGNWEEAWKHLEGIFDTFKGAIARIIEAVIQLFLDFVGVDMDEFRTKWEEFKDNVAKVWEMVIDLFKATWTKIKNFFSGEGLTNLKTAFDTKWQEFKNNVGAIWENVVEKFKATWTNIKNFFSGEGLTNLKTAFDTKWQEFKNNVAKVWESVVDLFKATWTKIKNFFSGEGLTNLKTAFDIKWQEFKNNVGAVWESVVTAFKTTWTNIKNLFSGEGLNNLKTAFDTKWQEFKDNVANIWESVVTSFKTTWTNIKNVFKTEGITNLTEWFTTQWTNFVNGLKTLWEGFKTTIANVFGSVIGFFESFVSGNIPAMKNAWQEMTTSVNTNSVALKEQAETTWAAMRGELHETENKVTQFDRKWQTSSNNMKTYWTGFEEYFGTSSGEVNENIASMETRAITFAEIWEGKNQANKEVFENFVAAHQQKTTEAEQAISTLQGGITTFSEQWDTGINENKKTVDQFGTDVTQKFTEIGNSINGVDVLTFKTNWNNNLSIYDLDTEGIKKAKTAFGDLDSNMSKVESRSSNVNEKWSKIVEGATRWVDKFYQWWDNFWNSQEEEEEERSLNIPVSYYSEGLNIDDDITRAIPTFTRLALDTNSRSILPKNRNFSPSRSNSLTPSNIGKIVESTINSMMSNNSREIILEIDGQTLAKATTQYFNRENGRIGGVVR